MLPKLNRTGLKKRRSRADSGFVLLLALALTAVIAASAIALLHTGRSSRVAVAAAIEHTRVELALDAGLSRASQAMSDPSDALRETLFSSSDPIRWQFDGLGIGLQATAEGGKIDLNTSRPELREAGLRLAAAKGIMLTETAAPYASVDALLRPCDRASAAAGRLREIFTIYTSQPGLTPHLASPVLLEGLNLFSPAELNAIREHRADPNTLYRGALLQRIDGMVSHGASVYTVRASIISSDHALRAKEAVILLTNSYPYVRTIETRRINAAASLCD
jgi:hypothetical protein